MKIISFTETFANVHTYASAYNEQFIFLDAAGKKRLQLTCCLRSSHIALFQEIIRCYAAQLCKITPLPNQELPPFSTNNHILANRLGISSRTVQRYIIKLQESGLILHKIFKGSIACFDLYLNTDILYTYPQIQHTPACHKQIISKDNIDYQLFTQEPTTSCLHKDTSSLTNLLINSVNSGKLSDDTYTSSLPPNQAQLGNTGTGNTGQELGAGQQAATGNSAAPARLAQLEEWVDKLFFFMQHTLFHKLPYLSTSQINKGKHFLTTYFNACTPENYQQCYKHLQKRALIAHHYMTRNDNRFIPLPAIYLDPDNPHGFSKTEIWYNRWIISQTKSAHLNKHHEQHIFLWNIFQDAFHAYQLQPCIHNYLHTRTRLSQYNPELIQAFDRALSHSSSAK